MSFSITVVNRVAHGHFFVRGLNNVFPHLNSGFVMAGTVLGFACHPTPCPSTMPGVPDTLRKCQLNEGILNEE